jgi:hypothetical protein
VSEYCQYPLYRGGAGGVHPPQHTNSGGTRMASSGGKLVPVTTKPQIQKLRANGIRKATQGAMGAPSSKGQKR